jgi:hypothetical protein
MAMKVAPPYSLLCLDLSGAQWTVAPFVCKAVIGTCPSNQCPLGRAQARTSPSPTRCPQHAWPAPPRSGTSRLCLEAAASRYAQALAVAADTPQALNNWGLVLQACKLGTGDDYVLVWAACAAGRGTSS